MKKKSIDSSKLIQLSSTVKMDFYEKIDLLNISQPITKEGIPVISTKDLKESKKSIDYILYQIGSYEQYSRDLENEEYSEFDKKITEESELSFNILTKECIGIFKILRDMEDLLWDYKRTHDEDCESSILKNLHIFKNSLITIHDICSELFIKRTQRNEISYISVNYHLTVCLLLIKDTCRDMLTNNLVDIPSPL